MCLLLLLIPPAVMLHHPQIGLLSQTSSCRLSVLAYPSPKTCIFPFDTTSVNCQGYPCVRNDDIFSNQQHYSAIYQQAETKAYIWHHVILPAINCKLIWTHGLKLLLVLLLHTNGIHQDSRTWTSNLPTTIIVNIYFCLLVWCYIFVY